MYERKIKEDLNCGIVVTMRVLGAKWKPCIIDAVSRGYARPSEIHRWIPEATPRVLDMQLSELYEMGIVARSTGERFPLHTEYYLTPLGESLVPVVRQLEEWGNRHKDELKERLTAVAE